MPGGSTRFCFTINNYNDEDIAWLEQTDIFKYVCFGKEVAPTTLTPHLQGYFEFPHGSRKSREACIAFLQRNGCPCHPSLRIANGTGPQNVTYCSKDGVFWEKGERPKGQGKRSDIDAATDILSNGGSLQEVAQSLPSVFVKFHRGLREYQLITQTRRNWKTEVYWLWGPTGSGKSRWAWESFPDAYMKQSTTKWWCGYVDQDTCIIDDFRPTKELQFNFILNLFDRYPLLLETKGGQVQCLFKTIIVTCPFSPDQMLTHLEWVGIEQGNQLKRRIDHVIEFPQIASYFLAKRTEQSG